MNLTLSPHSLHFAFPNIIIHLVLIISDCKLLCCISIKRERERERELRIKEII
jgi:hypothetical protein